MDRLKALENEWEQLPTTDQLAAAYMGFKPKKKAADVSELLSMFPGGVIGG